MKGIDNLTSLAFHGFLPLFKFVDKIVHLLITGLWRVFVCEVGGGVKKGEGSSGFP